MLLLLPVVRALIPYGVRRRPHRGSNETFCFLKIHLRNDYYSSFGEFDSTLSGVNEFSSKQFSIPSGWWVNTINELTGV